jgi:hypothetical protein
VFVVDALGSWLVEQAASSLARRLGERMLGSEQQRALHEVGRKAIWRTAAQLAPVDAEHAAMVVDEVFQAELPADKTLDGGTGRSATVLEALCAGMAARLLVLGDPTVTGTGISSAQALGVPVELLTQTLIQEVLEEIRIRALGGGPLEPLARQLNDDVTHLQLRGQARLGLRTAAAVEQLAEQLGRLTEQARPRFFLDLSEFEELLEKRGLLVAPFAGRREELDEVERLLADQGRAVIIEAPGGFGKTRLAVELARAGRSTPWFVVDYGLAFQTDYLTEVETGYDVTVLIDDAHRRTDLDQLLRALERRDPKPRLVYTVRPGRAAVVETALRGLALPQPQRFRLDVLGRSALDTILSGPPFRIAREGMRSWIIAVSEGNVGVALIAGELAAAGHYPSELSQAELFAQHVNVRLHGAGVDSRQTRDLLAVVASVGSLELGDADDVAAAIEVLGGDRPQLRERLDELADLGIVEEATGIYTIKPDVIREHLLRASFFPEVGQRPLLRYRDVYAAFAPCRLYALLEALGQAQIDTIPAAAAALATIRQDLIALLEQATTAGEFEHVMLAARALGAGGGAIVCELAEATLDRLDGDDADQIAVRLVEALAAAKLGRDQLPRAWRVLLRVATVVCGRTGTPRACEAALAEIREIHRLAPIGLAARDSYVLAYIQRAVRERSQAWWAWARGQPGAARIAATIVGVAFTLELQAERQAAANRWAMTLVAGFVPASAETEALLRLGATLFHDSYLDLRPDEQLKALAAINALAQVADGYQGRYGAQPPKDLQELAGSVLGELEQWLAGRLRELPLPVAAAVLSYFRLRRRRRGDIPSPPARGDLRVYVDLVDNNDHGRIRLDRESELAELRARSARYGDMLMRSADPVAMLERWNGWIEACQALTARPANHLPLKFALARVAQSAPALATRLAAHMIEHQLTITRFSDAMLDDLAGQQATWPLIQRWAADPSPGVRGAGARALNRAPEELARRVAATLAQDADVSVRDQLWHTLVYGGAALSGWRVDLAFALAEASATPLDSLGQLLAALGHRAGGGPARLSAKQRKAAERIVLGSAPADLPPHNHRVQLTLTQVERFGLDLVIPWLQARLAYVKRQAAGGHYIHPLSDELEPLLHARRRRAAAKRELNRLLDELEASASGVYRLGVEEAVRWLGIDSGELTQRINQWARAGDDKLGLAFAFLATASWPVFTERARVLLDARPNDPQVREALLRVRDPSYSNGFIGDLEPSYRAAAAEYRRWTRSRDPRLRKLGQEGVALYERRAYEEAAKERREQERV